MGRSGESLIVALLAGASLVAAGRAASAMRTERLRGLLGGTHLPSQGNGSRTSPRHRPLDRGLRWVGERTLARRLPGSGASFDRRLLLAGRGRDRDRSLGARTSVAVLGAIAVAWMLRSPMALVAGPAAAFGLLRAYDLRLARSAARRQRAIERQVPEMVELLVATSDAGLAPGQAFERARSMLRPPLGPELDRVVRAVQLGEPWRNALEDLVGRSEVPSLRRVTAALARSGRLGTSLDVTLRTLAEDLRDERRARAEDAARRAPVKMLFPLVFLILPAFLLLTVGPVLLATLRSLH